MGVRGYFRGPLWAGFVPAELDRGNAMLGPTTKRSRRVLDTPTRDLTTTSIQTHGEEGAVAYSVTLPDGWHTRRPVRSRCGLRCLSAPGGRGCRS